MILVVALACAGPGCKSDSAAGAEAQFRLSNPAVFVAPGTLRSPQGIAVDRNGNVWVADSRNNKLRKFSAQGVQTDSIDLVTVIPNRIAIDKRTGDILVVVNDNRIDRYVTETKTLLSSDLLVPFSGDASTVWDVNTRSTRALSVSVTSVAGIASTPTGEVFLAAHGAPQNFVIKSLNGNLSVVAYSSLPPNVNSEIGPRFIAADDFGTVFTSFTMVAGSGSNVTRLYSISPGSITQSKAINEPFVTGVARGAEIDAAGYIYIAEPLLQELVVVLATAERTVQRYLIPDVPGLSANRAPQDVAVSSDGAVYVVLNDLQSPTDGPGAIIRFTRSTQ